MNGSETSRMTGGESLSHYAILEKIGEGGSGAVYKARDTDLNRVVALKVLAAGKRGGSDERFRHDARLASSLNHPNIATVYETGRAGDTEFVAMEHVPGRTLAAVLESGKPSWREGAQYAVQIADALAAAHEAGVIHRALKPGNVIITPAGVAKVLDFGLANVTGSEGADAYTSPEQREGRRVDTRSDIFSFGALLAAMVAADDAGTPGQLQGVVERCLRANPGRRYQKMEDVKAALEDLLRAPSGKGVSRQKRFVAAIAAAATLIAIAAWKWGGGEPAGQQVDGDLARLTADAALSTDPVISRDGSLLAYASDRAGGPSLDIWIQRLPGGDPRRLTSDDADDRQPAFSPDGAQLAFRSERDGGGVYLVSAEGGEPRLLAKDGRDPRFSPDGTRVAYWRGNPGKPLEAQAFTVSVKGGRPERMAADFADARYPVWSPDGAQIALVGSYRDRGDWWIVPVAGGERKATGAYEILRMQGFSRPGDATGALAIPSVWQPDGFLFAGISGETASLWRAPYSARLGQVTGSAERLTRRAGWDLQPSASQAGDIVFSGSQVNLDIWSAPLEADTGEVRGELKRIVAGAGREFQPSVSMDGTRLLYRSNTGGRDCIRVKDLASGKDEKHCISELEGSPASLSPGGTRIAYRVHGRTRAMNADGSEDKQICRGCRPWAWLPDEKQLLIQYGSRRLSVITDGDPESREVLRGEDHAISEPRPSPDGKWIAFHQIRGPEGRQVFVAPFREKDSVPEKEWIPITGDSGNDRNAHWSPDGNLLYFLSDRDAFRCVWAQRLDPRSKRPRGAPFAVQHFHHARLSLMQGANTGEVGFSIAKDRLVLSVIERTGNIWMLRAKR